VSYTTSELVRSHLSTASDTAEGSINLPFTLTGIAARPFFTGAVQEGSLIVRSVRQRDLSTASFTLTAAVHTLNANGVRPDSVTLASDSSLRLIYIENVDYVVDWANGKIAIKPGGALSVGQTVIAWFYPYSQYVEDVDYRIDYVKGEIARNSSGDIADGETVWLGFTPESSAFSEDLIAAGVRDANALIEAEVDPGREFGADPVLVSAATYRALEIVCRAAAARELASRRGLHQTATAWMNLSETYNRLAERWVKSFRPPASSPASPAIS